MAVQQGDIIFAQINEVCKGHPKFFIVASVPINNIDVAIIFINTDINVNVFPTPELQALHHKLLKSDYAFLDYDSWVDCSSIKEFPYEEVDGYKTDNPGNIKGLLLNKDIVSILALLGSPDNNISPKKKRTYGF